MKSLKKGISNIFDSGVSVAITLVLLGLALGAGWVLFNKVYGATEVSLVSTIISETKQLRAANGYGTSDYVPALIKGGSISTTTTISGNQIYNKSGGVVTVTGSGVGFIVAETLLSDKDCIKLATQFGTTDMASTTINGTAFTTAVDAVTATGACSGSDKNSISFKTKS
ncbi:conjugal transfer protein [Buttiauxella sp. B2]|uniref:type 4 pilus major pilin n=1 Tax=Buttiauxella sp. B2 TaxID=2587812 RepID=UPI001121306F|nr:type 4 pilus major pilin [Buttiauxella sp. B2]TNV16093.1 conjugal transfer protein [Buttiauxella sp. B2]